MNKEFIPYEQALELKELGFDEECLGWHNSNKLFIDNYNNYNSKMPFEYCCSIPLYQQAFRWFREKYQLKGYVGSYGFEIVNTNKYMDILSSGFYSEIYEETELACLKKLIEIAKNK